MTKKLAAVANNTSDFRPPLHFVPFPKMDPVSTDLDNAAMDSEDGGDPVADLKTQLGHLQIGGGGDMLIDDYDPVDEKQDVAIITTDESPEEREPELLADDCKFPSQAVLRPFKAHV